MGRNTLFESKGTLKYSYNESYGYRLVVEVDREIAKYYRSFIPKYVNFNVPMYPAHISVVRREVPKNLEFWGKYDGEFLEFVYSNEINQGTVYWWLNAFSKKLEEIRLELGLPVSSRYTRPPGDYTRCFHITIANNK